jgi:predicted GIY-YIG superfamily endonuclease
VSPHPLTEAARAAPNRPGVYFLVSRFAELLYIGTAGDLRRRLGQHARPGPGRLRRVYPRVAAVHWEEHEDETAAACREADLIVALRPAANAALAGDGRWVYVVVRPVDGDRLSFTLTDEPSAHDGRVFGCFAHLGRGVASVPGTACSDGYPALLRALWAAGDERPVPAVLTRVAPPAATVPVPAEHRRPLHDLLNGTSTRLLDLLATAEVDPVRRAALTRDRDRAAAFARLGPRRLRDLRRRHRLPAGAVARDDIVRLLADEVRALIGPFVVQAPEDDRLGLGRRGRGRALRRSLSGPDTFVEPPG